MARLFDSYDSIILRKNLDSLPNFRGYDIETGEFGEWGVLYVWLKDKWMTSDEAEDDYRERMGIVPRVYS